MIPDLAVSAIAIDMVSDGQDLGAAGPALASSCNGVGSIPAGVGGALATSRVQKGHDLVTETGETVQVKYLANPEGTWVNEHPVDFRGGCDRYALLIVEALDAKALVVFSREGLAGVCSELGKRHPNQELTLQFTRANYQAIATRPERFEPFGVTFVQL